MTSEYSARDTKLEIPYVSQYLDIADAKQRLLGCGMTCTYMALKGFGANVPSLDELITRGVQEGGYIEAGWVHDYLVRIFTEAGYTCVRHEHLRDRDTEEFRTTIKAGNPVIVSVVRRMWDRRDFHMVLLTGVRESADGHLEGFFYHDPASLHRESAPHRYVPLSTFLLDWRRMAILPRRG